MSVPLACGVHQNVNEGVPLIYITFYGRQHGPLGTLHLTVMADTTLKLTVMANTADVPVGNVNNCWILLRPLGAVYLRSGPSSDWLIWPTPKYNLARSYLRVWPTPQTGDFH